MLHIALHFLVPGVIAWLAWSTRWRVAYLIMASTIAVDLDHLLATPIYDPGRCSIGFHPLHTAVPITAYIALCLFPKTRLIGVGLVVHMALDALDCATM